MCLSTLPGKSCTIVQDKLLYSPNPLINWNRAEMKNTKIKNKLGGIYHPSNSGSYFLSIDLKGANFIVMQANKLTDAKSWYDYLSQFMNDSAILSYFSKLKMLRLKALSVLLLYPANQKLYWENITLCLLNNLIEQKILNANDFAICASSTLWGIVMKSFFILLRTIC